MAMADNADRQLVDDFVQRIVELAQEAVNGQSKYSATELLALANFRIATKAPRLSSNKVNPFNIFQQEVRSNENLELRKPAPGTAGVNKGRPAFTGAYQKELAEEYKRRQAEFQQKAKELNEAPPDKVEKGSDLKTHRKLIKMAHTFSGELSSHGAHHIIMIVSNSQLPAFKPVSYVSDGYGRTFYKLMETNGWSMVRFLILC
jgi:hypothetical protein